MMPALILAGARDTKFVAAGRELAQGWGGDATFLEVPYAGHAAHLERPEMTADIIGRWLAELS
jgi:pimeloyl-ACP methyl ester carboxylesterase